MGAKPILENVNVRTYQGRYKIQLEIPETSTLTATEIDTIGAICSWDVDPNDAAEGYEGVRAVLISREKPIATRGIELRALQISGIGHLTIEDLRKNKMSIPFLPPSKNNFIDLVSGTLMSTSRAVNGKLITTRPSYRALGTYLAAELEEKVRGTTIVSHFRLEHLVTPHVEAYGRFLDDSLRDENGYFGFLVLPSPAIDKRRVGEEIYDVMESAPYPKTLDKGLTKFFNYMHASILPLIKGLRELHDKERYVHHQTHLSNFYNINGNSYLVDWGTITRLGEDREDNILDRVIDVKIPVDTFKKVFSGVFDMLSSYDHDIAELRAIENVLKVYSNSPQDIYALTLVPRARSILGRQPEDYEIMAQWMKDQGFEGFPKYTPTSREDRTPLSFNSLPPMRTPFLTPPHDIKISSPRIGRNDACPCGSGRKYKQCCMRRQ
ncbi:MAG: motif [archaeon]|jgi:hypothetical protein